MLPNFLMEETTVRESGESAVFDANEHSNQNLLLTFAITHAVEHESIDISDLLDQRMGYPGLRSQLPALRPSIIAELIS